MKQNITETNTQDVFVVFGVFFFFFFFFFVMKMCMHVGHIHLSVFLSFESGYTPLWVAYLVNLFLFNFSLRI